MTKTKEFINFALLELTKVCLNRIAIENSKNEIVTEYMRLIQCCRILLIAAQESDSEHLFGIVKDVMNTIEYVKNCLKDKDYVYKDNVSFGLQAVLSQYRKCLSSLYDER